ncbi:hypothetical protein BV20DRAFT_954794 [Pilatotrama ljubarskyi]|nr:hypothetical protein BV20DRAFT_954794 [Pilatotrama ljubarskyi]
MSSEGPPWYVRDHTSEIQILGVPERLQNHRELQRRGLVPVDPLKLGFVYATSHRQRPQYVIKILDLDTQELAVYERLLRLDPASPNHTLPCEISELGHPLLIMPHLTSVYSIHGGRIWTLYQLLGVFLQIVEGVEFLHRHHIAHMDLCIDNVLGANAANARDHKCVEFGKVYIIDFGSSMAFQRGPGEQGAVVLPPTQVHPPNGVKHFDPYSWDIYCVAHILKAVLEVCDWETKWIAHRYVRWLVGNERECSGVCRCRPTAQKARQVLALIRALVYIADVSVRSARSAWQVLRSFIPTL